VENDKFGMASLFDVVACCRAIDGGMIRCLLLVDIPEAILQHPYANVRIEFVVREKIGSDLTRWEFTSIDIAVSRLSVPFRRCIHDTTGS
jgi:hypothetical protein